MAEKNDTNGDSHNNGKYAMYINESQPGPDHGPNVIKPGENLNPVTTQRGRYDADTMRAKAGSSIPPGASNGASRATSC